MSKSYYRVSFSSNSQLCVKNTLNLLKCQRAIIVFPFQAIHNFYNIHLIRILMSKSYYRVSFSSNSQPKIINLKAKYNVKELLSCFLFKQFTTNVNRWFTFVKCQRAIIVFPFQAIHNGGNKEIAPYHNVKELLSCFLFKQFTTE